ncbi:MAG TPA: tRNA (guanosine(46)-N7)-methyltransferase TrmB [Steroidobacteraceae bacterium]|nr:tRNA (guanosine(46)-N7)-methyltransferase TrmB [Steroidobacteraceae bacterium]
MNPMKPHVDDHDAPTPVDEPSLPGNTRPPRRAIRSFVVRAGRMTHAQERAWRDLWPAWGVDKGDAPLDFAAMFGRVAPVTLEIGFGNGESLIALAAAHSERVYVGLEVHPPGVGHLLLCCESAGVTNVRVLCQDAVEVLQQRVPDASLEEVLLYFPDPWPKKRHHKRRIVQPAFVDLVARKLQPGGVLRMATDWQAYAEHMLATAGACTALRNESATGDYVERPSSRPVTRFERRGQRLGHGVWDLAFRKK